MSKRIAYTGFFAAYGVIALLLVFGRAEPPRAEARSLTFVSAAHQAAE